jgi:hypothetical protein
MKLNQWLKKQNAWLFGARHSRYAPGYIFQKRKPLFGASRFEQWGQAWITLDREPESFEPIEASADLVTGTWETAFDAGIDSGLGEVGIDLGADTSFVRSVTLRASGVTAKHLDDRSFAPNDLARELVGVIKKDRLKPVEKSRLYLAFTLYYASEFTVDLSTEGGVAARSEIERAGVETRANVSWKTDNQLVYSSSADVPFAFTGPKLRVF